MGRAPCCDKANVKKGPWSPEEDLKLKEYIEKNGTGGNWIALPQKAGLKRCGKSCRLRWLNYLRPNIKHGEFTEEEDRIICSLFATIGSRWSIIAAQLPGRTDNDIKNYWNTKLKKKLMGLIPSSQKKPPLFPSSQGTPPPLAPSSSSPLSPHYKDCASYYFPCTRPFLGLEPVSISSNLLSSMAQNSSMFQPHDSLVSTPMHIHQVKENNFHMFGSEASCSSSDGSHGREIKQEIPMDAFQSYHNNVPNGFEESQKYMHLGYGGNNGGDQNVNNPSGFVGQLQTPLDQYDIENVKQLVSSSNGFESFFFSNNIEENREKLMYMYNNYY